MIKPIILKPGDLFSTRNPAFLGRAINIVQCVWSRDNTACYSHSGIIETSEGDTYEAIWSIKEGHLKNYCNENIVIARYTNINKDDFINAMIKLKKRHDNQWYPWWRIPLHIIPPLAKYVSYKGKFVVCSELTAEVEYLLGLRHNQFTGTTPDTLSDEWHRWQGWEIVGEGKLICKDDKFYIDNEGKKN